MFSLKNLVKAKTPLDIIEELGSYLHFLSAFPDNKVKGVSFETGSAEGSTAWYNLIDGKVTVTQRLLDSLETLAKPNLIEGCIRVILKHEAWHSSYTKLWPNEITSSQKLILNHLEDWRNHNFLLNYWPSEAEGMEALYQVLAADREDLNKENKEKFLKEIKDESKEIQDKLVTRCEVLDLWMGISHRTPYPNFEFQMDEVIKNSGCTPLTKEVLTKCKPHILAFRAAQPRPFDATDIEAKSLAAIIEAYAIFKILDPYFNFETEKKMENGGGISPSELKKKIEEELEKRGEKSEPKDKGPKSKPSENKEKGEEPGQGQPSEQGEPSPGQGDGEGQEGDGKGGEKDGKGKGKPSDSKGKGGKCDGSCAPSSGDKDSEEKDAQGKSEPDPALEDVSTNELKAMRDVLEQLEQLPNQGEQSHADKLSPEEITQAQERIGAKKKATDSSSDASKSNVKGYSDGTGEIDKPTDPVTQSTYDKFTLTNNKLIRYVRKLFANARKKSLLERGHQSAPGRLGQRVRIRGVIGHMSAPTDSSKIFWQREGRMTQGQAHLVLENLLIALDLSGSMQDVVRLMKLLVGITCEASREAKVPTSVVAARNGYPEVLASGAINEDRRDVIKRVLNIKASGGTDMGNGALQILSQLKRQTAKAPVSRMLIVTDCCTSESDLLEVAKYIKKIKYPTCILALGTSHENAQTVHETIPEASIIVFDESSTDINIYKYFVSLADWMSNPTKYHSKPIRFLSEFGSSIHEPSGSMLKGLDFELDDD